MIWMDVEMADARIALGENGNDLLVSQRQ